ncbi:unnamed protein product [Boreogadus saida]
MAGKPSRTMNPWLCFHLLLVTGCLADPQRSDNVYVSGISNACGDVAELVRASSGVITSPGWPFQYPSTLNCSWNIRGKPGDIITLSFQDFELQGSQHCALDWLSIGSYRSLEGYRACGSALPAPYISTQDHVWLHFHSDRAQAAKGFRLSYITGRAEAAGCEPGQFHCSNGKCVPESWRCNNMDECGDRSDEERCGPPAAAAFSFQPCAFNQFPCLSRYTRVYTCLPHALKCDGSIDCQDLGDEIDCDVPTCGEHLKNFYGSFNSPNYPDFYPPGSNCTWIIDTGDTRKVVLRFTDLKLDGTGYGDYVKVYDGLTEAPRRLLRVLTAFDSRAPVVVVSTSGRLRVHFYADKINAARGFNATYQVEGFCLPWEVPCGGDWGCYSEAQRCDGYWHCPNGRDELNCSSCQEEEFPCSRHGACYPRSDRCNYQNRCPNGSDEKNCYFCQPGNFHCKNNRCVFESWVCDAQDDCGDGSDEESCPVVVPTRVITAAVIGSLVCGLLLVIALGCTCKLYSLRMFERRSFETQLSRVEAELLRREAPPSYGQLIAQGLIPPVEDFPVCSGSQASVLENLRLAVRSQLGFTSLRLPSSGRHGSLWRGLFWSSRSRRSGSLPLVSADPPHPPQEGGGARAEEPSPPSPAGAEGGALSLLPRKAPPPGAVEAVVSVVTEPAPPPLPQPPPAPPAPGRSTLGRLARGLRLLALLLPRRGGGGGGRQQEAQDEEEEDEEDVELLIPDSSPSALASGRALRHHHRGGGGGDDYYGEGYHGEGYHGDGPCEHCGMVHTAQIPAACLEGGGGGGGGGGKTESSDDELLLLC